MATVVRRPNGVAISYSGLPTFAIDVSWSLPPVWRLSARFNSAVVPLMKSDSPDEVQRRLTEYLADLARIELEGGTLVVRAEL